MASLLRKVNNMNQEPPKIYDPTGLASAKERIPLSFRIMGYVPSNDKQLPDEYNRFRPEDQVKVMNILDHMFYWQVLDPRNEDVKLIPFRGVIQKRTVRQAPDMWGIAPGEVKVLPGWSAVIMIEKMYKQYIIETTDAKPRPEATKNRAITYNFDNAAKQEEIISKIFLGIEKSSREPLSYISNPTGSPIEAGEPQETITTADSEPEVSVEDLAKELGINVGQSTE